MKKSIALLALVLTVSSAVFAKAPIDDLITINPLRTALGVGISVNADDASKSIVRVYNADMTVHFVDKLANKGIAAKAYLLNKLDEGNYTIEVITKEQTVKKQVRVYDEDGKKAFFIFQ